MSSGSDLRFVYVAIGENAETVTGEVLAASAAEASASLAGRGLHALTISPRRSRRAAPTRMPLEAAAGGMRTLAELLATDIPLDRALTVMAAAPTRHWTATRLVAVRDAVRSGRTLAAALSDAAVPVPTDVLQFVRAGEESGTRQVALERAADVLEARATRRREIRSALAYPTLIGALAAASLALLVGFVLPKLALLLQDAGAATPAGLQLLLSVNAAARRLAVPAAIAVAVMVVGAQRALRGDPTRRLKLHAAMWRLPIVGPIRRAQSAELGFGMLAEMLTTGVPLVRCLRIAAAGANDLEFSQRLGAVEESVRSGAAPAEAFARHTIADEACVQLVRIGEETGRLAVMLRRAAAREREFSESRLRAAVRALEPALIIICGLAVGGVAASVLSAIYSIRPT